MSHITNEFKEVYTCSEENLRVRLLKGVNQTGETETSEPLVHFSADFLKGGIWQPLLDKPICTKVPCHVSQLTLEQMGKYICGQFSETLASALAPEEPTTTASFVSMPAPTLPSGAIMRLGQQLANLAASDFVDGEMGVKALNMLLHALPKHPRSYDTSDNPGYWSNGDAFLCSCETEASILSDFISTFGVVAQTGYYDPEEDARSNEQDDCTGFWYVTWE